MNSKSINWLKYPVNDTPIEGYILENYGYWGLGFFLDLCKKIMQSGTAGLYTENSQIFFNYFNVKKLKFNYNPKIIKLSKKQKKFLQDLEKKNIIYYTNGKLIIDFVNDQIENIYNKKEYDKERRNLPKTHIQNEVSSHQIESEKKVSSHPNQSEFTFDPSLFKDKDKDNDDAINKANISFSKNPGASSFLDTPLKAKQIADKLLKSAGLNKGKNEEESVLPDSNLVAEEES